MSASRTSSEPADVLKLKQGQPVSGYFLQLKASTSGRRSISPARNENTLAYLLSINSLQLKPDEGGSDEARDHFLALTLSPPKVVKTGGRHKRENSISEITVAAAVLELGRPNRQNCRYPVVLRRKKDGNIEITESKAPAPSIVSRTAFAVKNALLSNYTVKTLENLSLILDKAPKDVSKSEYSKETLGYWLLAFQLILCKGHGANLEVLVAPEGVQDHHLWSLPKEAGPVLNAIGNKLRDLKGKDGPDHFCAVILELYIPRGSTQEGQGPSKKAGVVRNVKKDPNHLQYVWNEKRKKYGERYDPYDVIPSRPPSV